jgi:hypothetical protein
MPCGHPASSVVSSGEGTCYCRDCEIAARETLSQVQVFCPKGLETPQARIEFAELLRSIDTHWDEL